MKLALVKQMVHLRNRLLHSYWNLTYTGLGVGSHAQQVLGLSQPGHQNGCIGLWWSCTRMDIVRPIRVRQDDLKDANAWLTSSWTDRRTG